MKVKYPRTYHLPFSPGSTSDDKTLKDQDFFNNFNQKTITITEKLDGENTTMYSDYIHARSLDSKHHPSRDWVKRYHAELAPHLPINWRFCGENLFAQHSISYDNLNSYFYGFSIWDENNMCLSIDETKFWFDLLGIQHAPILSSFDCINNWMDIVKKYSEDSVRDGKEGIVIRNNSSFHYDDFKSNVAKYVRPNHVQTDTHWMSKKVIPNKLRINL